MEAYKQQIKKVYLGATNVKPIVEHVPVQNDITPFKIYQTHVIYFDFLEKIRILFGKKVTVYGELEVDKEVSVLSGSSRTTVDTIFKPKRKGMQEVSPMRNMDEF